MASSPNDSRRRAAAAEAVAGAGIGLAAASNRIPEAVNAYARQPRKQAYKEGKSEYKSGKVYYKGKWTDLSSVPEKTGGELKEHVKADGTKIQYRAKTETPRQKLDRFTDPTPERLKNDPSAQQVKSLKAEYHNKERLPFPEKAWEYEDDTKKAPDPKTGRYPQKKKIWTTSPEGKRVMTAAAKGEFRRAGVMAVGIPAGLGLAWHGARTYAQESQLKRAAERKEAVSKDISRRDVDAAITGGSIGGAVYHAPSFAEWAYRSKWDKKVAKNPKAQAAVKQWKKKYDLTGAQKGVDRWHKAYRNLPDEIPAAKIRRAMAYTHTGANGIVLTGAAALAGAGIGVRTSRQHQRKKLARQKRREQRKMLVSKKHREVSEDVKHKRAVQGALSIGGASLGLAALGSKGGAVALKKYPKALKSVSGLPRQAKRLKTKTLNDASITLTTAGAGLGGLSGYHFAALQRAENKAQKEREAAK